MKEYQICFNFTPATAEPTKEYNDSKSYFNYSNKQGYFNGELITGFSQIYVPPMSYMPGGFVLFKNGYVYFGPEGGDGNIRSITTDQPLITNNPPVANNAAMSMKEDSAATIALTGYDADGDTLAYQLVTPPDSSHGSVSITGSRATFTPKENWNGVTSFTFRVRDSEGAYSNTANVSVTVTPLNDVPSVVDRTLTLDEDTVGTLSLTVTDVDLQFEGDSHTWSIVSPPNAAHGVASISGNKLTYTPVKDWFGTETLTYRARDSKNADSNVGTITIVVSQVNDAPVVTNQSMGMLEDTAATITLPVTDADPNDSHTFHIVTGPNSGHGTVVINGNKLTFTPSPNWNGSTTFTYQARDSASAYSNTATVSVTVNPVNDAPSVVNRTLTLDEDSVSSLNLSVIDVDLQHEGDSHTWHIVTPPNPAQGSASIAGDKLTFTPVKDWFGTATLTYRARDAKNVDSNVATVTFVVNPVNDKPVVQPVDQTVPEDTVLDVDLLASDVDSTPPFVFEVIGSLDPKQASYSLAGSRLTVTPARDWNGTLNLTYRAKDAEGAWSDVEPITIEVTYVNDTPTYTGATIPAKEGMASDHVAPSVEDVDNTYGDEHTFEIVSQPANGTARVVYGMLEYTPNPQFYGADKFVIRATDKAGAFIDGDVQVNVAKFNFAPTDIVPGVVSMFAGIGGTAELKVIDPNTWGSNTLSVVGQPAHGTASIDGSTLTLRTDDQAETSVRIRATDQDGLYVEKNIVLNFESAWGMFEGRTIQPSGASVAVPAVRQFMQRRDGSYALQLTDTTVLNALGNDIVAVVTPDSPIGVKLEHRDLEPEAGMRLVPFKRTASYLEARIAGLNVGVDGVANLYLSRADMTGPVYSVPVHSWAPQGQLEASAWEVRQAIEPTSIKFAPTSDVCAVLTAESQVKNRNVLQDPACLIEWDTKPEEWRDTSNSTTLSMEAYGRTIGQHPVKAKAYVFDAKGNKHWIADFDHQLTVLTAADTIGFGLQPAPAQTYQAVQDLALVLRQNSGRSCDVTTTEMIARNVAKQWQAKPMCFIRWTTMPEGLAQSATWHIPQVVGAATVLGEQTISWKASVFTPSGEEVDLTYGSHSLEVIAPPPIEIDFPTANLVGQDLYAVSQLGGYVGNVNLTTLAADIDLKVDRDHQEIESSTVPSYGRNQRVTRYVEADERPLWSMTPYTFTARYSKLPALETVKEMQLLAVPHPQILPVILNDERRVLDTQSMPISVQMQDTRYPLDGYRPASMGDWDIRLLMTTTGSSYEPVTDWEPINDNGQADFELDLALLTNKMVRVVAEARVRSPVPGYESVRKSSFPLALTVLNGDPLDGMIQALRVVGPAPLRSTFYAMTVNRTETSDIGDVRWEWSRDDGSTWEEIVNDSPLPQRLTKVFEKGSYLLRAEITNRHSGAKSFTPQIEVVAYEVPVARLKGPANVFISDTGRFSLTDIEGEPLDTTGMVVEWSEDRGQTWTAGDGTHDVSRTEAERVYLMARLKYADSPDDNRVYRNLRAGVAFRAVRPPRVQIIGPRRPEVGKEAIWKANMMMPYPNMGLTMDGYFVLPNGDEVHELEAAYTPTMEDFQEEKSYVGFVGWINGYEEKGGKGLTQHRLVFWSYDWPEWSISAKTSAVYAPADLNLQARALGLFREFEGLEMEWDIPSEPGLEIVKDTSQTSRILRINAPGTYTFGVHVSDARGNYSFVETELTFMEPIPYDVTLTWSGDNPAMRAPLGVLIRPRITGGHPKDRIETRQYSLNGEPMASSGDYGRATLEKGQHNVRLDIASEMGQTAHGEVTIKVEENKPPVCSIEVTPGRSSWIARATCTDEDGRMANNLWFVDGVQQSLTSSSISVPMWRYPNGEPIITVVGVDDSGAESAEVSNY